MPKVNETVLEIDLRALAHNYRFLKSRLHANTLFLAVVKAFAYGSDASEIARKLEHLGVDYFAVAYVKEGIALRDAGITKPILVLHPQSVNFNAMIERCLEPSIYSPKILEAFLATAQRHSQKEYPIHLKFNTGLNRLGFLENEVPWIMDRIQGSNVIKVASIFSHLAASEDLNEIAFTRKQIARFLSIGKAIDASLGHPTRKHILNTSGIINFPEAQLDMVRSGIGLYGFSNAKAIDLQLRPIATLKTIISQIHTIEPGETVGYNRAFASQGQKVTATLPLGHADGIGRHYGNDRAFVNIHGKYAPIIGNVCMDMIMIDITGIPCQEGDEVVVFGENPNAEAFAAFGGTISYELLTGISQRVTRIFVND